MKFIVKKGNVGGFGNRNFKKGDVVTDKDFSPRTSKSLVESGHLEIVTETESKSKNVFEGIVIDGKTFDEHTKPSIIAALENLEVDFKKGDSKPVLFKQLMDTIEKAGDGADDNGDGADDNVNPLDGVLDNGEE